MKAGQFSSTLRAGEKTADEVQATADHLASLLRWIHGGEWAVDIDHDAQFVAVSRNFQEAAQ